MRQVIVKLALMIAALAALSACQTTNRAASIRGACAAFDAPRTVIRGAERVSQRWIDRTVEAGISACGWSRPKARAIVARATGR